MSLMNRVERFINELGVSKSAFCQRVKLDVSTLWKWQHGQLELSNATLERIDNYLKKYHF